MISVSTEKRCINSQNTFQVLRALCKNKEAKEAFAVTQAKPEGALLVVTEDMEVLTGLEEIQIHMHYKY